MDTQSQRGWTGVRPDRVMTLFDQISIGLDADERVIFADMYEDSKRLYDKIIDEAWLARSRNGGPIDWVSKNKLDGVVDRVGPVDILGEAYIVRVRLPWNQVRYEWTCSAEQLADRREDYEVIEVIAHVHETGHPENVYLIDPTELEANRDKYTIVELRYLVRWKTFDKENNRDI